MFLKEEEGKSERKVLTQPPKGKKQHRQQQQHSGFYQILVSLICS